MARDDVMTAIVVDSIARDHRHSGTVVTVGCDCVNRQIDLRLHRNLYGRAFVVVGIDFRGMVRPIHSHLDVVDSNRTAHVEVQRVVLAAVHSVIYIFGVDNFAVIQELYGNVIISIVSIPRVGSEGYLYGIILIAGRRCDLQTRHRELIVFVDRCCGRGAVVICVILTVSVRPVDSCCNGL